MSIHKQLVKLAAKQAKEETAKYAAKTDIEKKLHKAITTQLKVNLPIQQLGVDRLGYVHIGIDKSKPEQFKLKGELEDDLEDLCKDIVPRFAVIMWDKF